MTDEPKDAPCAICGFAKHSHNRVTGRMYLPATGMRSAIECSGYLAPDAPKDAPLHYEVMREAELSICWRLLNGGADVCIRDRGHDEGAHEKPDAPSEQVDSPYSPMAWVEVCNHESEIASLREQLQAKRDELKEQVAHAYAVEAELAEAKAALRLIEEEIDPWPSHAYEEEKDGCREARPLTYTEIKDAVLGQLAEARRERERGD